MGQKGFAPVASCPQTCEPSGPSGQSLTQFPYMKRPVLETMQKQLCHWQETATNKLANSQAKKFLIQHNLKIRDNYNKLTRDLLCNIQKPV